VRFGLDDKDFVRFAYSRAMSRPDIGLLRNYVQINTPRRRGARLCRAPGSGIGSHLREPLLRPVLSPRTAASSSWSACWPALGSPS